jgi:hypothetical protein
MSIRGEQAAELRIKKNQGILVFFKALPPYSFVYPHIYLIPRLIKFW